MNSKKELALLALMLAVGALTFAINPRFLSAVNIGNLANLAGLFGIFALGVGLVIILGGIEPSVGSSSPSWG